MTDEQVQQAIETFKDIPDHRAPRGLNHPLAHLLVIALCAVMSGADSYREIEAFGIAKREWLRQFIALRRVPDHETFRRVFARLNPLHFQSYALDWIRQAIGGRLQDGDVISIDGKCLRGTHEQEVQGIYMLNVWAARQAQ